MISIGVYGAKRIDYGGVKVSDNRWSSAHAKLTAFHGEVYHNCSNVVRPRRRPRVVFAVSDASAPLLGTER